MKKTMLIVLAALLLLAFGITVYAAVEDTGFADVNVGDWYAEAVGQVRDAGLMNGINDTVFSPQAQADRAMLASILYRDSGSPVVSGENPFTDVGREDYYRDAAIWAAENGIMSGYGGGLFGGSDPVTREQLVTTLWRYAGSPAADEGQDFVDEADISDYARTAVDWSRANGVVNGMSDGSFDPQGNATRAQLAVILRNFTAMTDEEVTPTVESSGNSLVVYFSATGNTEAVAGYIADEVGADLYEILPETPYTEDDLDWTAEGSRVNLEHDDPDYRPTIAGQLPQLENYDTVYVGYPIWWGEAPNILRSFMESVDLSGKRVIPFCTSTSSDLGSSAATLEAFQPEANWQQGVRFGENPGEDQVRQWAREQEPEPEEAAQQESRILVAYFSMPETNEPDNMTTEEANSTVVIDGQVLGNTQYMAHVIQQHLNADSFRIEPVNPYPTDHDTLVDLASLEQADNARPAFRGEIDPRDYDVIFLGYPNWWGDMPMIMYSFLEEYDFSGKTIIPFNTHGGSGFSDTVPTIASLQPNAQVSPDGLTISRNQIQNAEGEIISWLDGLGL